METLQNKSVTQALKFVLTGLANTAVDFAVLNILILIFTIGTSGHFYIFFKAISFVFAVANSYFLNKYWVFEVRNKSFNLQESLLFFFISGIGFLLNISISTGVFFVITKSTIVNSHLSVNIGALVGSLTVLVWNYVGYKVVVFKK